MFLLHTTAVLGDEISLLWWAADGNAMSACNAFWPKHLKTLHHNRKKSQDPHSYTVTLKKQLKRISLCLSWNNTKPICRFYSSQHRQRGSLQYLRHRKIYPHLWEIWPSSYRPPSEYTLLMARQPSHIFYKQRPDGQLCTAACSSTKSAALLKLKSCITMKAAWTWNQSKPIDVPVRSDISWGKPETWALWSSSAGLPCSPEHPLGRAVRSHLAAHPLPFSGCWSGQRGSDHQCICDVLTCSACWIPL